MDRLPAVAGRFYPSDPKALSQQVSDFIGDAPSDDRCIGVVAPHAGYMYSGAIAGEVYRRIRVPDIVVILCPNHTGLGAREAIMTSGAWILPGGRMPIDVVHATELRDTAGLTEDPIAHLREHSLEVHLPFLAHRNPSTRIVPVCLGPSSYDMCRQLGQTLAEIIAKGKEDILIVASTDMSHYLPADVAREKDALALERIAALDDEGLYKTVVANDISMCGYIPTTVVLAAARALGAKSGTLVKYGNSGDTSGDYSQVVGYAGFVLQ